MKLVAALFFGLALALTACVDESKKEGNNDGYENITNYSICEQGRPFSIEGSWVISQRKGDEYSRMTMQIAKNSVQLRNECSKQGRTLTVQTSGSSRYDGFNLHFLSTGRDHKEINEESFKMTCSISVDPGSMPYTFRGPCLQFLDQGDQAGFTMVPAGYGLQLSDEN